ncbi:SOS response-associated peptidase [Rhodovulum sp. DZ06]|uniref:SOS response-associated peptidase n=1 Tax=Rhodovulum sp. DZ06 TaxID=3425126 RepID=UPI003D358C64
MCGRFALTLPADAVAHLFDASIPEGVEMRVAPRWNICPTTAVEVVRSGPEGRTLAPIRWGFIPRWYKSPEDGPLLINARSETIAEKPAFREACRARRCLVPASGFYEWQPPKLSGGRGKVPYWIHPAGADAPFALAAVWETWRAPDGREIDACALVTAEAGPQMAALHHREPVRVAPEHWGLWLGEEGRGAATLMHAAADGFWDAHPVSPRINGTGADDEMLTWEWRPEDGPPPAPEGAQRSLL